MRFVRIAHNGRTRVGLRVDRGYIDTGFDSMQALFAAGAAGLEQVGDRRRSPGQALEGRLLAPIAPGRIFGTGLNYRTYADHDPTFKDPGEPIVNFMKTPHTVIADGDAIVLPRSGAIPRPQGFRVMPEVELLAVLGSSVKSASLAQAEAAIFGYTIINDVTSLSMLETNAQMMLGKNPDTFAPIGPEIVTKDEIGEFGSLDISSTLNGVVIQDAVLADQINSPARLVEWISALMTLDAGDAIATGTPPHTPGPPDLQPGDTVTVRSSRIGSITNRVE